MTVPVDLLELIPDDDPTYLAAYQRCLRAGWQPAVAAVQAHTDLNMHPRHHELTETSQS